MSIPVNASIPPKINEYAYYDSRLAKYNEENVNNYPHWLIYTDKHKNSFVGCHYSLPEETEFRAYIVCHGVVKSITKRV